jgi:flagellar motor switch protein FliN/FliY
MPAPGLQREANVRTFDKVAIDITVVLGTTSMPVHQVLRLGRGAIIELDTSEDDAVSVLANNLPVAKGTVLSMATASRSMSTSCCRARRTCADRATRKPQAFDALRKTGPGQAAASPCPSGLYLLHDRRLGTAGLLKPGTLLPNAVMAELVDALA